MRFGRVERRAGTRILRRMSFTFLTAEWRKLIMAQYQVDPEILQRRLPPGVELDLYHGRCYVSLVGFLFDRVRLLGIPVPGHTRFEEINLRYYVRRPMPDGSYRRGVIFLSEIVPKPAITLVARALYGEAYSTSRTSHWWSTEGPDARAVRHHEKPLEIHYGWRGPRLQANGYRGDAQGIAVQAGSRLQPIEPGSLNEFITEHYWGYTPTRSGGTDEYAVEHPRWGVYPVEKYSVSCNFAAQYGPDFANLNGREPDHVLLAEGAPVRIRWGGTVA